MITELYDILVEKQPDKKILVLTGPEISFASGIPNIMSPHSYNFWGENLDSLLTKEMLYENPINLWNWVYNKRELINQKKPNISHTALAVLEKFYKENFALITQNIDNLHSVAGSFRILDLNGNLYKEKPISLYDTNILSPNWTIVPTNPKGQFLIPDLLLRDQEIHKHKRLQANLLAQQADICIIIGALNQQDYFSELPLVAKKYNNAFLIEINSADNYVEYVDMYINQKPENILPIMSKLIIEIEKGVQNKHST